MRRAVLLAGLFVLPLLAAPSLAAAPRIDFGDDASQYANDGECDDPRFTGPGMTSTPLLEDDIAHDASDCRAAYKAGQLSRLGVDEDGTIDFGDDAGEYANDGECDDPRFTGPGMTSTPLIDDDLMHDASDCRAAYKAGDLTLR